MRTGKAEQPPAIPANVRLRVALESVRADARRLPEEYARDTEVPEGGE